jgi:translation elongation factor EF-G
VEPGERGQGVIFKDEVKGGNIPKEYIRRRKGHREIAATGSLIGFPIIDSPRRSMTAPTTTSTHRLWPSRSPAVAACAKRLRRPASSCSSRS